MTAITADRDAQRKDGDVISYKVQQAEIIYKGTPVILDAGDKYVQSNDGTTLTLAAGDMFVGISYEKCDNSAGADGAKSVRVWRKGTFLLPFSDTLTQADVGKPVYVNNVSDDAVVTVTTDVTPQVQVQIGVIVAVDSANKAWVCIDGCIDKAAAAL